jgi:aspartyl-tRNA(Asn)/glutamyl-tRNA(Gln) amidotransferase subunit C
MKLSRQQVEHVAWLARLGLSETEIEKFTVELSHILGNFEMLGQVDTTNVLPATHAVPLQSVFREDESSSSYPQSDVLANAPRKEEDCFKVKPVLG